MYRFKGQNSIETSVGRALDSLGIGYVTNANPLSRFTFPDFLIRKKMVAIYVDGDYWHSKTKTKDALQDKVLIAAGYRVLRIQECEVKRGAEVVLSRIAEAFQ